MSPSPSFLTRIGFAALIVALSTQPTFAADTNELNVGIQFDEMPVGTQWVVVHEGRPTRYVYTYIGPDKGQHRLHIESRKPGKKPKQIAIRFFDAQGRMLRSESHLGEVRRFEPYDCAYRLGPCTHTYRYPLPPKNGKKRHKARKEQYHNVRSNNGINVVRISRSGERRSYGFELGRFNIRVSNQYTNALGKKRGFKVTSIKTP